MPKFLSGQREPTNYQGDDPECVPPTLDEAGLKEYGCEIVTTACFDQSTIVLHGLKPEDRPKFPYKYLGDPGKSYVPGYNDQAVVDAWPEGAYNFLHPLVRRNSSMDRPDIRDPVFSNCHVPLIWLPTWLFAYAELFINSFVPLWLMQDQKLIDNKVDLVPFAAGFAAPKYVEDLLRPYTTGMIMDFNILASREHVYDPKWPRCFNKVLMCEFAGMYHRRPPPRFNVTGNPLYPDNITYDGDPEFEKIFKPSRAGKHLVEYYTEKNLVNPPKREESILNIMVASRNGLVLYRQLLNLTSFLEACNSWILPENAAGYTGVKCSARSFGVDFYKDVEELQSVDILVGHHGAELNNGYFMKPGSSVVEIRMFQFDGMWPDLYFRSQFRTENTIFYFQAAVKKEGTWKPGYFESTEQPLQRTFSRDRNTVMRWSDFMPIFEKILSVGKNKQKYEDLLYQDIRFEI